MCSFTCTVDNDFAIVNFHWIADDDSYHMAPLCKFDLRIDDHFSHFAAWNEAIGEWASTSLLPQVKAAITRLHKTERQSPGFAEMKAAKQLSLATESNKNDMLIQSLKTTFDNIPWRFEDNEFTPVSSATATWGSPMVDDMLLSSLPFSSMRGLNLDSKAMPRSPRAILEDVPIKMDSSYLRPTHPPTPPTYNSELVSLKRLDHAMDEIRELHAGLEAIKDSSTDVKTQLSDLRDTLGSILRKESNNIRTRTVLTRRFSGSDLILSSPTDGPVAPISRPQNLPSMRHKREPLQIRTDLAPPHSSLRKSSVPPATPPELTFSSTSTGSTVSLPRSASPAPGSRKRTTPTLTLSCNGIDLLLSPRSLRRQPSAPLTGSFDSHKSPLSARAPAFPRVPGDLHSPTPITTQYIGTPPLPSPPKPKVQKETQTSPRYSQIEHSDVTVSIEDNSSWLSSYENASPEKKVIIRTVATVAAGYILTTMVPTALIKWFIVGCAADYCFRAVTGGKTSLFGILGEDTMRGEAEVERDTREQETDEDCEEEAERRS